MTSLKIPTIIMHNYALYAFGFIVNKAPKIKIAATGLTTSGVPTKCSTAIVQTIIKK